MLYFHATISIVESEFNMKSLAILSLLLPLSICSDPNVGDNRGALRPVDPRIEICSAGSAVQLSAEAKIDLDDILKRQGGVTGTVERKVETLISQAAGSALTGPDLVQAQSNYLACLREEANLAARNSKPWENYSAKQCTAYAGCEANRMAHVTSCREELQRVGQPYKECYSNLTNRLVACFDVQNADQLQLARSFCEVNYNL